MSYVDGFVLPVLKRNLPAYKRMAKQFASVCRKHGVVQYLECAGDDLNVKHGLSFTKLLKLKKGETAIFAWVFFKSRSHRDTVWKKIMSDPTMKPPKEMPFDVRRMAWGGFKPFIET